MIETIIGNDFNNWDTISNYSDSANEKKICRI